MTWQELLEAVADGRVTRELGIFARYELDGEVVGHNQLHFLKGRGLIAMPLSGPPRMRLDGYKALGRPAPDDCWY
jgi:hypothetical protein